VSGQLGGAVYSKDDNIRLQGKARPDGQCASGKCTKIVVGCNDAAMPRITKQWKVNGSSIHIGKHTPRTEHPSVVQAEPHCPAGAT
jgi:hypothetical protein